MRMARLQLRGNGGGDIGEGEVSGFLGHACMEHHLQQQIAEFVAQGVEIAALDRVGDFIGFLDRIGGDGGEALRTVPFAARDRVPELRHDPEEAVERFGHLGLIIYIMLNYVEARAASPPGDAALKSPSW